MLQENKTLVLFTATYPFGTGEVFIEHEISFLSEAFSEVIIFPQNTDSSWRRSTPSNVRVLKPNLAATAAISAFFSASFISEIISAAHSPRMAWVAFNSLKRARSILNALKQEQLNLDPARVVYYSYWLDDAAIALALLKQKQPYAKCISRAHGWDVYYERHMPEYLPFRSFLAAQLNGIYVISENGRRYIQEKVAEQNRNKVHTSRLGCKDFAGMETPFEAKEKIRIVSCSGAIPLKRIHLIIQSLALIHDTLIEWVHFGDGPLLSSLKTMAEEQLGSKPNIQYSFFGHAASAQIFAHYKTAHPDLFINVSETEGIPVSIMEALCFGIAAIATNVGGIAEIVEDKVNGYLLPANPEPMVIAAQIMYYASASDGTKSMLSTNARNVWETKYNANKNYTAFITAITAQV
jgi:glycosyltransferase involved in cell wall biosynthesis